MAHHAAVNPMNPENLSAAWSFMGGRLLGVAIVGALLLAGTGCGSVRRNMPTAAAAPLPDPKLERGRTAFAERCHKCHPGGEGGLGPALNNKPLPGFLIKTQTRFGLGAMPAFTRQALPPDELDDIVAYLKELRRR